MRKCQTEISGLRNMTGEMKTHLKASQTKNDAEDRMNKVEDISITYHYKRKGYNKLTRK